MKSLYAASTNVCTLSSSNPAYTPSAMSCRLVLADDSTLVPAGAVTFSSSALTVTLVPAEVPIASEGEQWEMQWSYTVSGAVTTVVEEYLIVVLGREPLVTKAEVKAMLNITDTEDDDFIDSLIEQAEDALESVYGLPTVPQVTESRVSIVDGYLVQIEECVSVTAVTDSCGNTLDYSTIGAERSSGFVRGVLLDNAVNDRVTVTGRWGYTTCPQDIKRAIMSTAGVWYKRGRLGSDMDVVGSLSGIPREAKDIMDARMTYTI